MSSDELALVKRLFVLAVLLSLMGFGGFLAYKGCQCEIGADYTPGPHVVALPWEPALAGTRTVDLAVSGAPALKAFYRPSPDGRVVLLLHGTGGDRAQLMPEARLLAGQGIGFLSLDFPGHGESGGTVAWGEPERSAVKRALAWLGAESDVRAIGILGFSMGSWFALQGAVDDPQVKGVMLTGPFADQEVMVKHQCGAWSWFGYKPALMLASYEGMRFGENRPLDLVQALGQRPLLIVAGGADTDVPAAMSKELFHAASGPKDLLVVRTATHGSYARVSPKAYGDKLLAFFAKALGP